MQDVNCPSLVLSPFWTSYPIWHLSTLMTLDFLLVGETVTVTTLMELNFLPMSGRWACTMYRYSARVRAVTKPAQHACVYIRSLVCQRSQEGRGVQYLQPGFMAVDISILTFTHAVNSIVHPKCLQWTGLCAHIPMSTPFTTWLWIWSVVLLMMCVMTSHYYIPLCHGNWLKLPNVHPVELAWTNEIGNIVFCSYSLILRMS